MQFPWINFMLVLGGLQVAVACCQVGQICDPKWTQYQCTLILRCITNIQTAELRVSFNVIVVFTLLAEPHGKVTLDNIALASFILVRLVYHQLIAICKYYKTSHNGTKILFNTIYKVALLPILKEILYMNMIGFILWLVGKKFSMCNPVAVLINRHLESNGVHISIEHQTASRKELRPFGQ